MMKKIVLVGCLGAFLNLNAQTEISWPEPGNFRMDTVTSKTSVNTLFIALGGYFKSTLLDKTPVNDFGIYGYGRYRIGKIASIAAYINQGLSDMPNGGGASSQQDVKACIYFMNKVMYTPGEKIVDQYSDVKYVAKYNYPSGTFYGFTGGIVNKKYFASVSDNTGKISDNATPVTGKEGVVQVNSQMLSFGLTNTMTSKFKGRIYYTTDKGAHQKKMARQNTVTDIYLEGLLGLHTKYSSNLYGFDGKNDAASVANLTYTNTKISTFGWRVGLTTIIKQVFSLNAQIASMPGLRDASQKGAINNLSFQVGLGIAIPAL